MLAGFERNWLQNGHRANKQSDAGIIVSMTREEIEKLAKQFSGNERYEQWMRCGRHDWRELPLTDSGEHYCSNCCGLWNSKGEMLNLPQK